jgi:hypothetical protein
MDDKSQISPEYLAQFKEMLRVSSKYAQGRKMRLAQALAKEIMSGGLDELPRDLTTLPTGEPVRPARNEYGPLDSISQAMEDHPGLTRKEA